LYILGLLNSAPAIFGSTTLDAFILQSKFVNTERIWGKMTVYQMG